jgi:hypothetical protein
MIRSISLRNQNKTIRIHLAVVHPSILSIGRTIAPDFSSNCDSTDISEQRNSDYNFPRLQFIVALEKREMRKNVCRRQSRRLKPRHRLPLKLDTLFSLPFTSRRV